MKLLLTLAIITGAYFYIFGYETQEENLLRRMTERHGLTLSKLDELGKQKYCSNIYYKSVCLEIK